MPDIKNRVTVVEQVYHQIVGQEPVPFESRYSYELQSDEQAYHRSCKAAEQFEAIDLGWLTNQEGMLVIRNEEGRNLTKKLSPEEQAELAQKQLLLGLPAVPDSCWVIAPGETIKGTPVSVQKLSIRATKGVVRFSLLILPR